MYGCVLVALVGSVRGRYRFVEGHGEWVDGKPLLLSLTPFADVFVDVEGISVDKTRCFVLSIRTNVLREKKGEGSRWSRSRTSLC